MVALLFRAIWGVVGVPGAVVFGLMATLIQVVSMAVVGPKIGTGDFRGLVSRWAVGTGLRLMGVVAVVVAVVVDRTLFPPLPSTFGYLAVLVPLLFFEVRRFR
jgi:hypothetical protein